MSRIALVQVTCPDLTSADIIAQALLAERLIACANILSGCTSVYRWQGVVERSEEALLQLKTLPHHVAAVTACIATLHPYDLPAIDHWEAHTTPAIAEWIADEVL